MWANWKNMLNLNFCRHFWGKLTISPPWAGIGRTNILSEGVDLPFKNLVGGFNPSEKYQNGNLLQIGLNLQENIRVVHHLETVDLVCQPVFFLQCRLGRCKDYISILVLIGWKGPGLVCWTIEAFQDTQSPSPGSLTASYTPEEWWVSDVETSPFWGQSIGLFSGVETVKHSGGVDPKKEHPRSVNHSHFLPKKTGSVSEGSTPPPSTPKEIAGVVRGLFKDNGSWTPPVFIRSLFLGGGTVDGRNPAKYPMFHKVWYITGGRSTGFLNHQQ